MDALAFDAINNRCKSIEDRMTEDRRESRQSRAELHEKVNSLDKNQMQMKIEIGTRLDRIEDMLADVTGSVKEVVALKNKARMAGALGAGLWKLGGVVLGIAAALSAAWSFFWKYFTMK